ncbi:MAG: hypothetical protein WEB37_00905, partial [Bacteroidota bacterium]
MVSKLIFLCVASALFLQCSKKSSVVGDEGPVEYKTLAFYINSANVPADVVEISITFTRAFSKSISDTARLNLVMSTTLRFDSISVGGWHMKIVMRNNSGGIVSIDDKDILVTKEAKTQLLGVTVDGEYIYIPHNDSTDTWIDHSSNPILAMAQPALPVRWMYNPVVLNEGGTYYMWFTGIQVDSSIRTINFAQSADSEQWSLGASQPILKPGASTDWDYNHIATGPILKENGEYRLYYNSLSDFTSDWKVGLATSTDRIQWTKASNPVLIPEGSEGYVNAVAA